MVYIYEYFNYLFYHMYEYICLCSAPNGKLRLLHEVAPMAYLIEQAGGKASTGNINKIIEILKIIISY